MMPPIHGLSVTLTLFPDHLVGVWLYFSPIYFFFFTYFCFWWFEFCLEILFCLLAEPTCQRNLDDLIETLAAQQNVPEPVPEQEADQEEETTLKPECATTELMKSGGADKSNADVEELRGEEREKSDELNSKKEEDEGEDSDHSMPSLEEACEMPVENIRATSQNVPESSLSGLRRRNRPEWIDLFTLSPNVLMLRNIYLLFIWASHIF